MLTQVCSTMSANISFMILTLSVQTHKNRKESPFGSTVMMVLLAFFKVLFYSDGHSPER